MRLLRRIYAWRLRNRTMRHARRVTTSWATRHHILQLANDLAHVPDDDH